MGKDRQEKKLRESGRVESDRDVTCATKGQRRCLVRKKQESLMTGINKGNVAICRRRAVFFRNS